MRRGQRNRYEIEGYIRDLQRKYSDLRIIFTGETVISLPND